jgi:carboxymethylenebutenolidase
VLFHFGEKDESISAEARDRIRDALPSAPIHVYPAQHGFNCEMRKEYDAPSAALALERTLSFFAEHLHP